MQHDDGTQYSLFFAAIASIMLMIFIAVTSVQHSNASSDITGNAYGVVDSSPNAPPIYHPYELDDRHDPALDRHTSYDGYIVRLKGAPMIRYASPSTDVVGHAASLSLYREQLQREHSSAKADIEARLGISSSELKAKVRAEYKASFNGFAIAISDDDAEALRRSPYVAQLYPDYAVSMSLMDSVPLIKANEAWLLDADGNSCLLSQKACIRGTGVRIAILDSGVDYTHHDLGGCLGSGCKVSGGYDFVNNDADPMDDNGHGTHVAAIAAGDGALKGVAPDATICAYKVLDNTGNGHSSAIISAIERVVDPNNDGDSSDHLDVMSLSLAGEGNPDDAMSISVDNAVDSGVVVAVAAGNAGYSQQTIRSPGTARKAITVAASEKSDYLADFSSRGPVIWTNNSNSTFFLSKPDITAPGVYICAAQWDSALNEMRCLDDDHVSMSGTSMATPHVAGVAALLRQAHPDWTPLEIKSVLKKSAKDIGFDITAQGAGRLDALSAIMSPRLPVASILDLSRPATLYVLRGTVSAASFSRYEIYYGAGLRAMQYQYLASGTVAVRDGIIYTFDGRDIFDDGYTTIKLRAYDTSGLFSEDKVVVLSRKLTINNPRNNDIIRLGDVIRITGMVDSANYTLSIRYALEGSADWKTQGIMLSHELGVLANWNTAYINKSGNYVLNFVVDQGSKRYESNVTVYLDSTLKKGWPVRIAEDYVDGVAAGMPGNKASSGNPADLVVSTSYQPASSMNTISLGMLEPAVDDINNDGLKEIIVYAGGSPPKLRVYRHDGALLWSKPVGSESFSGGNLHMPIIGDINNDVKKEILTFKPSDTRGELYAFRSDGSLLWKNTNLRPNLHPTLSMADIDNDGRKEIIIQPAARQGQDLFVTVINSDGSLRAEFPIERFSWGASITSTPATANLDADSDLEIVVAIPSTAAGEIIVDGSFMGWNNTGAIYVYNKDGSRVAGWPRYIDGLPLGSPVVADINNDGYNEIVVPTQYASMDYPDYRYGGLYAFDRRGNILPGWPAFNGYNFWSTPSLGDIDGDGKIEITSSMMNLDTYLMRYDGSVVAGWPRHTSWHDYYSSIRADVDGDGKDDIITTAGNGFYPLPGDGGVYAWDAAGKTIKGFPKFTEVDAQAPAVVADIDKDGKVELIASSNSDTDLVTGLPKGRGSIYVWKLDSAARDIPWPTYMHDNQHTGYLPSCTDSDGLNYYVRGSVNAYDCGGICYDYCKDAGVVREFYCSNSHSASILHACDYGCSDGACRKAPIDSCTDSDGGINYYLKGTAYGTSYGTSYSYTDSCNAYGTLAENYCSGTSPARMYYACPRHCDAYGCTGGCSNGACKQ